MPLNLARKIVKSGWLLCVLQGPYRGLATCGFSMPKSSNLVVSISPSHNSGPKGSFLDLALWTRKHGKIDDV